MKVLIIGLPYFAQKLQKQLSEYDKNNTYIFLNTHYNKLDKLKYIFHLINTDVIYIHGGLICCSELIDIALKLNKKIIMNWAGSDVLKAKEMKKRGKINFNYVNKIKHLCVSKFLQEELYEIGIKANVVDIISIKMNKNEKLNLPKIFKVLVYIGKDRPKFYGIETIIKLAKEFPQIDFRIVGLDHYENIPKNIKLLGWVENIEEEYRNCVVFIRIPEHDGSPFSIIEALSYGRIVFYNRKLPYVNYINSYEDLKKQLQKIIIDFNNGKLTINQDGIDFVRREFNKEKVLNNLIKVFNEK